MGTSFKRKKYSKVAGVLPSVVRHKGWDVKLDMHSFFPIWEKVVGREIASCSRPLKIVKQTLLLEVANSAWIQQLQFDKAQILENINATLKLSRLKDIRFVLPQEDEEDKRREEKISFISPDPEILQKFESQAALIEDDASREALVRLWYLSKACRRGKSK